MNNHSWLKQAVLVATAAVAGISAQAQNVVYDSSTPLNTVTQWITSTNEFGDQIKLAGTGPMDRTIGQFKLEYYLNNVISYNETLTVKIYANDGANGAPGSLLWTSGTFSITSPTGSGTQTLYQTAVFNDLTAADGTPLKVPDWITWTVSFGGIETEAGEGAGLLLRNEPTVGSNYSDYWEKLPSGWHTEVLDGTPVVFGAQVVSAAEVPEPSTIQLGILGAVGLLSSLAIRRRSSK